MGVILILGRHGVGACGLGEARAVQTGAGTGVGNIGVIPCAAAGAADGGLLVFLSRAVVGQGAVGEGDLGTDIGLIHELEGQRAGDVRIVLAADGDGPALIRCSRDVRLAVVGEISGRIRARDTHHVAGGSIRNRICDLRLGRSGGEEIGCRQRTCLYTGIVLQNIHRLGGSGAAVGSLGDLKLHSGRNHLQRVVAGLEAGAVMVHHCQRAQRDVVLTHILARFSAQRTIESCSLASDCTGRSVGQHRIGGGAIAFALTAVGRDGQRGLCNGILHAGGRLAQGDAGGVGTGIGGARDVFQFLWTIRAHLDVANGDITHRRTLPIVTACGHRGGFAAAVVSQLGGGRNGHAAAVCIGAAARLASGGDGRAACRVRPAMLMPGHGERLAVALVAIAALDENAVLIALVYGQPGDRERLALLAGMRCSINFFEPRGPVVF